MKTKINVNRYLFHVSHPIHREEILKFGLLALEKEYSSIPTGVFAHNMLGEPTSDWYPFVLTCESDYELGEMYGKNIVRAYDYWRIDTQMIDNKWCIDYAAQQDFATVLGYNPKNNYVYTDKDVSLRAITLFRFQNDEFWDFSGENGAYHFRSLGEFRPYKTLN